MQANYKRAAHLIWICTLFQKISNILNIAFEISTSTHKLNILPHGESLDSEGGCKVAFHFQNFILSSQSFNTI